MRKRSRHYRLRLGHDLPYTSASRPPETITITLDNPAEPDRAIYLEMSYDETTALIKALRSRQETIERWRQSDAPTGDPSPCDAA